MESIDVTWFIGKSHLSVPFRTTRVKGFAEFVAKEERDDDADHERAVESHDTIDEHGADGEVFLYAHSEKGAYAAA
ncbi:MAG TPA: hypothetical protein VKQ30_18740 [Ktedonobacterales bacterium]|nr:hypothetical protein [Ktedonobacterales bacterium]